MAVAEAVGGRFYAVSRGAQTGASRACKATTSRVLQRCILPLFRLYDIDCLLRVPTTEKTRLYRYLEDGATGLMVPHVSTVEKARELVESVNSRQIRICIAICIALPYAYRYA